MRTLILLAEAPTTPDVGSAKVKQPKKPAAKAATADAADDDLPETDEVHTEQPPHPDDEIDTDPDAEEDEPEEGATADVDPDAEDTDTDDVDEDDDTGDADVAATDPPDTVAIRVQRERLYDGVIDIQDQCEKLSAAALYILDRSTDVTARKFAGRSKQILDDTQAQCKILQTRFIDLGYERARDLYATARERVAAVAEIIKHVIDSDDDFQKSGSTNTLRNGPAPKSERGRSV